MTVSPGCGSTATSMPTTLHVVAAADDRYARPLAVTLLSACRGLSPKHRIRMFVLDGGLSDESWRGLEATLGGQPIDIHPIALTPESFNHLKVSHHITRTAYFRLRAAELLPASVNRVIYLDSDLRVMDDLATLWRLPTGSEYCHAAVDIAAPYIDARLGSRNFRRSSPYMATLRPVPNYRELGLDGRAEYFNSGVMLLNLATWRREDVGERLLRCLSDHEQHVWCWDQYALNVVCADRWVRLPVRWNQGAHAFAYPSVKHSPIDQDEFVEMRDRPAIVHFTTEFKPWHRRSMHPHGHLFFEMLDQTAWRSWRPPTRPSTIAERWQSLAQAVRERWTIYSRTVAAIGS